MTMSVPEHFLKDLEAEGPVPEYLKDALVSEIDFIRDTMSAVSHSVGAFLDTALMLITSTHPQEEE